MVFSRNIKVLFVCNLLKLKVNVYIFLRTEKHYMLQISHESSYDYFFMRKYYKNHTDIMRKGNTCASRKDNLQFSCENHAIIVRNY